MRSFLLLNVAMLACAISASAQNPSGTGSVTNSAAMNANRQTVHRPAQGVAQAPPAVELRAETPVVTLKGVCEAAMKAQSQDCQTVITQQAAAGLTQSRLDVESAAPASRITEMLS